MKRYITKKIPAVFLAAVMLLTVLQAGITVVNAQEPITVANIRIDVPADGEHPDFTPVSDEPEKYSASVESWYLYESPYPHLDNNSVFEHGKNYALRVLFEAKSGYEFADNAVYRINNQSTSCYGSSQHREIIYELCGSQFDVSSGAELKNALSRNLPVKEINIVSNITVSSDCTIMFDPEHLDNYYDTVVTVKKGVVVTVNDGGLLGAFWPSYEGDGENGPLPNGKLINNGGIIIKKGGGVVADFDTNNGEIVVEDGGECVCPQTNNGDIYVENGGEYRTTQGSVSRNFGTVNVAPEATMQARFGSTIINETGGIINLDGTFLCGCVGFESDAMWFENHGTVNGQGSIILTEADRSVAPVSDMDALIVELMAQLGQEKRFDNWDDVNIFRLREVGSFEELAAEFPGDRTVAGEDVEGDMDVMVSVETDITVPKGEKIETMGKIFLSGGATLTVSGGAILECALQNNANIVVESGGKLKTTMGGNIENRGRITVNEGGEIESQMGAEIVNCEDAKLILEGEMFCGCIGFGSDVCWLRNSGEITGGGKIILYEAGPSDMPVGDMAALAENVRTATFSLESPLPKVAFAGDINGDTKVNNKDLIILFRYIAGYNVQPDADALDINNDGAVNNKDLIRLLKYLSGWDVRIY